MDSAKKFTNCQLFAHYTSGENRSEDARKILHFLLAELNISEEELDEEKKAKLEKKIINLLTQYDKKWKESNSTKERFENKNRSWFDKIFGVRFV